MAYDGASAPPPDAKIGAADAVVDAAAGATDDAAVDAAIGAPIGEAADVVAGASVGVAANDAEDAAGNVACDDADEREGKDAACSCAVGNDAVRLMKGGVGDSAMGDPGKRLPGE